MPIHQPKLPQNPVMQEAGERLRNEMTREERHLWYDFLRAFRPRFYRQYTIGSYIVDFYCPEARIVIEADGAPHFTKEGQANDAVRTDYLNSLNVQVLRFSNESIMKSFKDVCQSIAAHVQKASCN